MVVAIQVFVFLFVLEIGGCYAVRVSGSQDKMRDVNATKRVSLNEHSLSVLLCLVLYAICPREYDDYN